MNVYTQMELHKDELTPRELQVYDAVLSDSELVRGSTSTELARAVGVSQSVVSRFCQKVGFRGYGDFRMSLHQATGHQAVAAEDGDVDSLIAPYESALLELRGFLTDDLLEDIARQIMSARDVYLTGYGISSISATLLASLLAQDCVHAHAPGIGSEVELLHFTSSEDLFIIFSLKNRSHENLLDTIPDLKPESRPHTLLISGTRRHPLRDRVDQMIALPSWSALRNDAYLPPAYSTMLFCMLVSSTVSRLQGEA